jgi:hypothetical protein
MVVGDELHSVDSGVSIRLTTEARRARRKVFLIKTNFELCELGASAVNPSSP